MLRELGDEQVTTCLYTFGAFLAFRTNEADDTGLPTIDAFRRLRHVGCSRVRAAGSG